jgi:hypothetical protein
MKKILFLLSAFVFTSVAYSQSILTDKTKYQVRRLATNKGYEAVVPLVCGDGETKKNVKVFYAIDSVSKKTADTLYQLSTLMVLNVQAKFKCKNTFSWQPSEISILNSNESGTVVIFKGSAENSYGSRNAVTVYFKRKNGEFIDL